MRLLFDIKLQSLNEEQFVIDQEISKELDNLVKDKLIKDLLELEVEIINNLEDPEFRDEIDYWHTALTKIRQRRAELSIQHLYDQFLEKHKDAIEEAAQLNASKEQFKTPIQTEESKLRIQRLNEEIERLEESQKDHQKIVPGGYNLDHKTMANIRFDLNDSFSFENFEEAPTLNFYDEEAVEYEEDEKEFEDDVIFFKGKQYEWSYKYKPRKPRFFNRVKTGFEWNEYNKAHYNTDNPPPKVVQGYKFNIFYPDLIDKQETPKYHLEKCEDPSKLRIIFKSGPPYEDIAFEIVNKEWELRERHGFKCVFDRGILHLYFNFKRPK
jgi:hypothetical protein